MYCTIYCHLKDALIGARRPDRFDHQDRLSVNPSVLRWLGTALDGQTDPMKTEKRSSVRQYVRRQKTKKKSSSVPYYSPIGGKKSSPPKFSIPSNFDEDDDEIMNEWKATSPQTFFDFDGRAGRGRGESCLCIYSVGESGVVGRKW